MSDDPVLTQLRRLCERCDTLTARVSELEATVRPRPVTSLTAAARVVEVSPDTFLRHFDATGQPRPKRWWWSGPDAVREFWADLHRHPSPEPPPEPPLPSPRARPGSDRAVNPRELLRELQGRPASR